MRVGLGKQGKRGCIFHRDKPIGHVDVRETKLRHASVEIFRHFRTHSVSIPSRQIFGIDQCFIGCQKCQKLNTVGFQHLAQGVHSQHFSLGMCNSISIGQELLGHLLSIIIINGGSVIQPTFFTRGDEMTVGLAVSRPKVLVIDSYDRLVQTEVLAGIFLKLLLISVGLVRFKRPFRLGGRVKMSFQRLDCKNTCNLLHNRHKQKEHQQPEKHHIIFPEPFHGVVLFLFF